MYSHYCMRFLEVIYSDFDLSIWMYSFTTEANSIALNAAVEAISEKSDVEDVASEGSYAFGIPEAVVTPYLRLSSLKGLKYSDASYVATLSPV